MKNEGQKMTREQLAEIRQSLDSSPEIEEAAGRIHLAGNPTRLKLLYLLETMGELKVGDLAELLDVSMSAVSQHLAKLKAYQLVKPRREAQTIYYSLTSHPFNEKLCENFLKQL